MKMNARQVAIGIAMSLMNFIICFSVSAEASSGMEYRTSSWQSILTEASSSNKAIFIKVYADWCTPCREMEETVFSNGNLNRFYNNNFLNFRADVSTEIGAQIKDQFNITHLPSFVFIDADENILYQETGVKSVEGLLNVGQSVLSQIRQYAKTDLGIYKDFELHKMDKLYRSGKNSATFLYAYVQRLQKEDRDYQKVLDQYINKISSKKTALRAHKEMKLIYSFTESIDQKSFEYLTKDIEIYRQRFGKKNVDRKIETILKQSLETAIEKNDEVLFDQCIEQAEKSGLENKEEFIIAMKSRYYVGTQDWYDYVPMINELIEEDKLKATDIVSACWVLIQEGETYHLKQLKQWSKGALKMKDIYYTNEVYATVLFRLGKIRKAEKYAEIALEQAREANRGFASAESLLNEIIDYKN